MGLNKRVYTDHETVITADNMNDIQDAIIALEEDGPDVIVSTASGATIAIADSSSKKLKGLNVYGKSTQASTPTPTTPVDIVSVGDGGEVAITISGKNILKNNAVSATKQGITFTVNADKSITVNGTSTGYTDCYLFGSNADNGEYVFFPKGSKILGHAVNNTMMIMRDKTLGPVYGYAAIQEALNKQNIYAYGFCVRVEPGLTVSNVTVYPMISLAAGTYVPYNGQDAPTATPNGLRAIPVTDKTLATYTDASGKMWYADEIDLAKGVYIQRVYAKVFTGEESFTKMEAASGGNYYALNSTTPANNTGDILTGALCNYLPEKKPGTLWSITGDGFAISAVNQPIRLQIESLASIDALKAQLAAWYANGEPMVMVFRLATPVETALTDDEIATYKALHTNKPNTTILNDENAYMSVKYIADTKNYIDNKVSGIVTATVE